jgi:predicted GNAT superfamily acetyltransferase
MDSHLDEIGQICPGYVIRPIESQSGFQRCVELQIRVWNYADATDVVPTAFLAITHHNGGILLGAYDLQRRMVGFVYSILGYHHGRLVQHSHMLGVLPAYRGRNIGLALKLAQRETALRQGVTRVVWTYDPLQSRNARFNFDRLGIWVDSYEVNFYGRSSSPLHGGLETDRFFAAWDLKSPRVKRKVHEALKHICVDRNKPELPLINTVRLEPDGLAHPIGSLALLNDERFLFEIPADIGRIKSERPASARKFQNQLRQTCLTYFPQGYRVTGCFGDTAACSHRHYYLFEKHSKGT